MSAAPDQAELAPSRDPAAYGRRPLRRSSFLIWPLVCVACLAVGAAVDRFAFPPPAPKPRISAPSAPAASRGAISPTPAATPPVPAPAAAAQDAGDTSLADRVARLESAASRQNTAAAAALAAASLAAAAQSGAPFERDLAAYERLAPNDPDLRALIPLAGGAPSRAALAAALSDYAEAAVLAEREPAAGAGFLDRFWAMVGRVVIVRKVDPEAAGLDGALTRAQDLASAGDLEGSLRVLEQTSPAARARLGGWLAAARRRTEVDQHLASLRARALEALTGPSAAAAPAPGASTAPPPG